MPVSECWTTVEGHRMRYLRAGAGPALVLLHGLLGYSFSWRLNLAPLAQQATVYAPDFLGIGFSDRPRGLDCSMRATAERMLRFMDAAGIAEADVLGTSHGGAVAVLMSALCLERQAPRVRRLILAAPVNPWSKHGRFMTRALARSLGGLALRACAPLLAPAHGYFLGRMYGDRRRIPPGSSEGYSRSLRQPGTVDYALGILRCWRQDLLELESAYRRIAQVPTLLLWGTRDPAVLPASAARLQAILVHSQLVLISGAGHLPYEETPEEFNRAVLEFLGK